MFFATFQVNRSDSLLTFNFLIDFIQKESNISSGQTNSIREKQFFIYEYIKIWDWNFSMVGWLVFAWLLLYLNEI